MRGLLSDAEQTHFPCRECDNGRGKVLCPRCREQRCEQHLLLEVKEGSVGQQHTETFWVQGPLLGVRRIPASLHGMPGTIVEHPIYGPSEPRTRTVTVQVSVLLGTTHDAQSANLPLPAALASPAFSDAGRRAAIEAWTAPRNQCIRCREQAGERAARQAMAVEDRRRQEREREQHEREAEEARRRAEERQAEERRRAEEEGARQQAHATAVQENRERFGSDGALRRRFGRACAAASAPSVPRVLGLLTLGGALAAGVLQLDRDWLQASTEQILIRQTHRDVVAWPLGVIAGASVSLVLGILDLVVRARCRRAASRAARIAEGIGCGKRECAECQVPPPPVAAPSLSRSEAVSPQITIAVLAAAIIAFVVFILGREVRQFRDASVPESLRSECSEDTKPSGVYYALRCVGPAVSAKGLTVLYLNRTEDDSPGLADVLSGDHCRLTQSSRTNRELARCGSTLAAWTGDHQLVGIAHGRRAARFANRRATTP